jgi:hypothetical protein
VTEQLCFEFTEPNAAMLTPKFRREVPAGAERLLRELVKRGLPEGDLRVAAELCLLLDEGSRA